MAKDRQSLKSLPHLVERALLKRRFAFARSMANVPTQMMERLGSELDQLLARSNLIAKNATNASIIDGMQEQIDRLKKMAQKYLPGG